MVPQLPPEIQLAQRLAGNEQVTRDRAVRKLRKYIVARTQRAAGWRVARGAASGTGPAGWGRGAAGRGGGGSGPGWVASEPRGPARLRGYFRRPLPAAFVTCHCNAPCVTIGLSFEFHCSVCSARAENMLVNWSLL